MEVTLNPSLRPNQLSGNYNFSPDDAAAAFPPEGESPELDALYYDLFGPGANLLSVADKFDRLAALARAVDAANAAKQITGTVGAAQPKGT